MRSPGPRSMLIGMSDGLPPNNRLNRTRRRRAPNCGARVSRGDWSIEVTGKNATEVEKVASTLVGTIPVHDQSLPTATRPSVPGTIQLFISHSSADHELVACLVELVRDATDLPPSAIRCTSVDGYRLPAGAAFGEQLRAEIQSAKGFVGVVSSNSIDSVYVLFELGARWGAQKHLAPILAPGADASLLKGPLASLSALRLDSAGQVHQLVTELGQVLQIPVHPPALYHAYIEKVVAHASAT
jgi:hypothetical protein